MAVLNLYLNDGKVFAMGYTHGVLMQVKTGIFDAYGCIIIQLLERMRLSEFESEGEGTMKP